MLCESGCELGLVTIMVSPGTLTILVESVEKCRIIVPAARGFEGAKISE